MNRYHIPFALVLIMVVNGLVFGRSLDWLLLWLCALVVLTTSLDLQFARTQARPWTRPVLTVLAGLSLGLIGLRPPGSRSASMKAAKPAITA